MDKKDFVSKARDAFDKFKKVVWTSGALPASAITSTVVTAPMIFVNSMLEGVNQEMGMINGVRPPFSPEAAEINMNILQLGAGIAGATFATVLVANWVSDISERLNELDRIKQGLPPKQPEEDNPNRIRGAVKLTPDQIKARDEADALKPKPEPKMSSLDAFYASHGYHDLVQSKPEQTEKNSPKMG